MVNEAKWPPIQFFPEKIEGALQHCRNPNDPLCLDEHRFDSLADFARSDGCRGTTKTGLQRAAWLVDEGHWARIEQAMKDSHDRLRTHVKQLGDEYFKEQFLIRFEEVVTKMNLDNRK